MRLTFVLLLWCIHAVCKKLYTANTFEYLGILSPANEWNGVQVVDWNDSKASRVLMDLWEEDAQFEIAIAGLTDCVYDGFNATLIACFGSESNLELSDDDGDEAFELRKTCKQVGKSGGFELRSFFIKDIENGTEWFQYYFLNMDKRTSEAPVLIDAIKFADAGNTECRDVEDFKFVELRNETTNEPYTILLYCIHTDRTESFSRTFDVYLFPQMCEPIRLAKPNHLIAKVYFDKETIENCTRSENTNDNCTYDYDVAFQKATLYPHHGVKYPTSADDAKLYGGTFFAYNVIKEKAMNSSVTIVPESVDKIVRDNIDKVSDVLISIFTNDYNDYNISAVMALYDKCQDFKIDDSKFDVIKDRLASATMLMNDIRKESKQYFDKSSGSVEGSISACFKSNSSDFGKEIGKAVVLSAPISDTERVKVEKKAGKDCGYDMCKGINWPAENVTEEQIADIGREKGEDVYTKLGQRKWNESEAAAHDDTNIVYGVWMNHSAFDSFNDALHTFYVDLGAEFAKFFFQKLSSEGSQILSAVVGEEIASRVGDQLNKFIAKDLEKEVQTQKPVEKIIGAMRNRLKKDFDALFANEDSSASLIPTLEFLRNASFTAFKHMNDTIKREPIPYVDMMRQFVYVFHGVQFRTGFVQGFTDNPDALDHAADMCVTKSQEPTFCER